MIISTYYEYEAQGLRHSSGACRLYPIHGTDRKILLEKKKAREIYATIALSSVSILLFLDLYPLTELK
jgi:hypothetical protein